jgi:hypothetical protein
MVVVWFSGCSAPRTKMTATISTRTTKSAKAIFMANSEKEIRRRRECEYGSADAVFREVNFGIRTKRSACDAATRKKESATPKSVVDAHQCTRMPNREFISRSASQASGWITARVMRKM